MEHLYDVSPRHALRLQHECARLGLQWSISARSWRFPAELLLLEVFQDDQATLNHLTWTQQVMENSIEPDQETPNEYHQEAYVSSLLAKQEDSTNEAA